MSVRPPGISHISDLCGGSDIQSVSLCVDFRHHRRPVGNTSNVQETPPSPWRCYSSSPRVQRDSCRESRGSRELMCNHGSRPAARPVLHVQSPEWSQWDWWNGMNVWSLSLCLTFYSLTLPISSRVTPSHHLFFFRSCCGDQRSLFCPSQSPLFCYRFKHLALSAARTVLPLGVNCQNSNWQKYSTVVVTVFWFCRPSSGLCLNRGHNSSHPRLRWA